MYGYERPHNDQRRPQCFASRRRGEGDLSRRNYSLAGPVILDRDWLTIEGEQHPMRVYYTGPYPSAAAEGSPASKFKVVTSGVNAIQFSALTT